MIRRGTNFTTTREMIAPGVWKTTFLDAHIDGRVVIFKTISLNQHSVHQDFQALPVDITLSNAAELLIKMKGNLIDRRAHNVETSDIVPQPEPKVRNV